ncbi:MAG: hypothetical protein Q9165_001177 [Trypethelium subeluteriae]
MASQTNFLPPYSPIDFSLTKGTSIPSPPATPPKQEPITRLPSRPPTPGRGPLNSHPTTPVDLDNLPASPAASQNHTPAGSPPPGPRARKGSNLRTSSYDMLSPTTSTFTTTVSSPAASTRPNVTPQNKRSLLGLRRLSGAFDSNIRYDRTEEHHNNSHSNSNSPDDKAHETEVASPRPIRPFSPVGGFISSFKPRSRTSSLNTGTTSAAEDLASNASGSISGRQGYGLRKKKSGSWFRRRMSGMPLGVGVETVDEVQVSGKEDAAHDSMEVAGGRHDGGGFRHGGYVTDLERRVQEGDDEGGEREEAEEEEKQQKTPPPRLPDLGMGIGQGQFAGEDGGLDLFGRIR